MARLKWEDRQYNGYFTMPGIGSRGTGANARLPEARSHCDRPKGARQSHPRRSEGESALQNKLIFLLRPPLFF
ncbi:MAG: hypothetical protein U9N73_07200 [Candidatus Auribacterota bacterium]|nr:hypothetical protein [Candidatus Auribacterota bacterium]